MATILVGPFAKETERALLAAPFPDRHSRPMRSWWCRRPFHAPREGNSREGAACCDFAGISKEFSAREERGVDGHVFGFRFVVCNRE